MSWVLLLRRKREREKKKKEKEKKERFGGFERWGRNPTTAMDGTKGKAESKTQAEK